MGRLLGRKQEVVGLVREKTDNAHEEKEEEGKRKRQRVKDMPKKYATEPQNTARSTTHIRKRSTKSIERQPHTTSHSQGNEAHRVVGGLQFPRFHE